MVFHVIHNSLWNYIFAVVGFIQPIVAIIMLVVLANKEVKIKRCHNVILGSMISVVIICIVGLIMGVQQRVDQNNANFSKQLMSEYGATSSRSFYEIDSDLLRSNEANTVFTKDGNDTSVFIKLVHSDGNQDTMVFNVIDEKSLFPKLTK